MTQIKITVIEPVPLKISIFDNELEKEFRASAKRVESLFQQTVRTWKTKVVFKKEFTLSNTKWTYFVFTDNQVYAWVNDGTKPHIIEPKKEGGMLVFPSLTKAKTSPGRIKSRKGARSQTLTFAPIVKHPGAEARKFDEEIKKIEEPVLVKEAQKALNRAVRRSGWKI